MTTPELPLPSPTVRWFMPDGCVAQREDGLREVFVGGTLIGCFQPRDRCLRNALLLGLARGSSVHLGHLADAFAITAETLRLIRKVEQERGIIAALQRSPSGRPPKRSARLERRVEEMFEQGLRPSEAHAQIGGRVGLRTVGRIRTAWLARRAAIEAVAPRQASQQQTELPLDDATAVASPTAPAQPATESTPTQAPPLVETPPPDAPSASTNAAASDASDTTASDDASGDDASDDASDAAASDDASDAAASDDASADMVHAIADGAMQPAAMVMQEDRDDRRGNERTDVRSARSVQHLGTWLLVAVVARLGLFARAEAVAHKRVAPSMLGIALEAVVAALAIGQRCVEGVRRLATRTAGVLLRARWVPSASWTRRVLGQLSSDMGGFLLHMAMATEYLRQAVRAAADPTVLYIDNHLRPYTGKRVLRRAWRMQDKRAVPGTSDYYVHTGDGRPVFRFAVPDHSSLPEQLPGIAMTIRDVLRITGPLLFAFDRAGSYPEHLATLRAEGFAFVTYERGPLHQLPRKAFTEKVWFGSEEDPEQVRYVVSRCNLGKARGRVKRIAMLVADERSASGTRQVNLLAMGEVQPWVLMDAMRGRWSQENGFHHDVTRWGTNQLDGRATRAYPPHAMIPNPARRRLDHALCAAREREATARRKLARLRPGPSEKRTSLEREIEEALTEQRELEAQRPSFPSHAKLEDTELAGVLEQHRDAYKTAVDTVRIACANAESELAVRLGTWMKKPAEAKKLLANVLCAPGNVRVGTDGIDVELDPAATTAERVAIDALFAEVNRWRLSLPGDPRSRPLRFASQKLWQAG